LTYQDNKQTQRTKKVVDVLIRVCNRYFLKGIDKARNGNLNVFEKDFLEEKQFFS